MTAFVLASLAECKCAGVVCELQSVRSMCTGKMTITALIDRTIRVKL